VNEPIAKVWDKWLSEHDQQEIRKLMVIKAKIYHKTVEGEYGCPGEDCPGVQRLVTLLGNWTSMLFLLIELPELTEKWQGSDDGHEWVDCEDDPTGSYGHVRKVWIER
jgi:hypothetical protein